MEDQTDPPAKGDEYRPWKPNLGGGDDHTPCRPHHEIDERVGEKVNSAPSFPPNSSSYGSWFQDVSGDRS
jgi:hypothetical protein